MRNYVRQFWARIDYDVDVNPPNPVVHEITYGMDATELGLKALIDQITADLQTDPRVLNIVPTLKGPLYWLLDQANLNLILQIPGAQAMQTIDQFGSYPNYVYSGPEDNPRKKGWTDEAGILRKPPPSEKTAKITQRSNVLLPQGVLNVVTNLLTFAAKLAQSRVLELKRIGEIIVQEIGLTFTGRQTINKALSILQPYLDEANKIING